MNKIINQESCRENQGLSKAIYKHEIYTCVDVDISIRGCALSAGKTAFCLHFNRLAGGIGKVLSSNKGVEAVIGFLDKGFM